MAGNTNVPSLERILIVKLADLGDALLTTPAIQALHQAFPAARIDALTTPAGAAIYELVPDIDRIIRFPKELFDRPTGLVRPWRTASFAWLTVPGSSSSARRTRAMRLKRSARLSRPPTSPAGRRLPSLPRSWGRL